MDTLKTYLPLSGWDVEQSWEHMEKRLRKGLNQLMQEEERGEGIENIILAMYVFENIPDATFIFWGSLDKTTHLLEWIPNLLRRPAREIAERLSKFALLRPTFLQDLSDLGYFIYFIRLFYCFSLQTIGEADPLFSSVFWESVEKYRALLRRGSLRIHLCARVHGLQQQLLWDRILLATTPEKRLHAASLVEQMKARLFLDIWYMKTCLEDDKKDWRKRDVDIDIPESIGRYVSDVSIRDIDAQPHSYDFPLYSPTQLLAYVDACLCNDELLPAVVVSTTDIQSLTDMLPEETAYLSYIQINDYLFVVVIRHGRLPAFYATQTYEQIKDLDNELEVEYGRIIKFIRLLARQNLPIHHRSVTRKPTSDNASDVACVLKPLGELYDLLFRDTHQVQNSDGNSLETYLDGIKTLLVSPSFPIQSLPFASLYNGKCFLGQEFTIAYVPNIAWAAQTCHGGPCVIMRALILADPDENLPNAQRECETVSALLKSYGIPVTLKKGREITRDWLIGHGPEYDLIHYAGHGGFTLDTSSYLKLADGHIAINDILTANWECKFFFLNACQTGERQVHLLEETLSLATALLAVGTHAVVSTLWPIEDALALLFATEFYRELLNGKSTGNAYRNALTILISHEPHPAAWSPYILTGNPHMRICLNK